MAFEYTTLKGGNIVIIVMYINLDYEICKNSKLKKGGISKMISLSTEKIDIVSTLKGKLPGYTEVIDDPVSVDYEYINEELMFMNIQKLTTI